MKIADQNTFRQFDRLKQQIFAHKHQQIKQKKQPINPFANLTKKLTSLLPLAVIIGAGWLLYHKRYDIKDYLIDNKMLSYQSCLVFQSLMTDLRCKAQHPSWYFNERQSSGFANEIYLTKLESDYLYLKQKIPEKLLKIRTKTNFSIWIFNVGIDQTTQLINSYGDLVTRHKKYKLNFGGIGNLWGKTQQTIIKRNKIFEHYLSEKENKTAHNNCQNVNLITKLLNSKDQYQKAVTTCKERQQRISTKIEEFISHRLRQQQKNKIKTKSPSLERLQQ